VTEWFAAGDSLNSLPIDDRGLQYGDGLFETIAVRGQQPRLLEHHLDRLQTGCERLGLPVPPRDALEDSLRGALAATSLPTDRVTAKILLTAGPGPRGYARSDAVKPTLLIGLSASQTLPETLYRRGARVRLCNTRLALQPQLAGIKSLNRLEQVLAREELRNESVFEGLLLDTDDRLICGTMSNVFLIDGNSLATPALTRCGVAGVMRRHVLSLLDENGLDCEVRDVGRGELASCDGILLANSQFAVLPIRRCDERRFGPNDLATRVLELVVASGVREYSP
jgi:4-amino-4-deoxychorismate lyase